MSSALDDLRASSPLAATRRGPGGLLRTYRSLFALDPRQAAFAVRGFPIGAEPLRRWLEQIGETFLAGFNLALVEDDAERLRRVVEQVAPDRRGFAVEGAAMGAAVADALMLGGSRLDAWMQRCEADYSYLAHVGAGWALARVPWRRAAILRGRDPVHVWLVFDGLGFHDAYFRPAKILSGRRRRERGYAARVYDQGIGRALWFLAGGDVRHAVGTLARFADERRPDLWSGLGLALAYAGGADPVALAAAAAAAGPARASLAQGAAFAAEAHACADHLPAHTDEAVRILAGVGATEAVDIVRQCRGALPRTESAGLPRYETWRKRVQQALA